MHVYGKNMLKLLSSFSRLSVEKLKHNKKMCVLIFLDTKDRQSLAEREKSFKLVKIIFDNKKESKKYLHHGNSRKIQHI